MLRLFLLGKLLNLVWPTCLHRDKLLHLVLGFNEVGWRGDVDFSCDALPYFGSHDT